MQNNGNLSVSSLIAAFVGISGLLGLISVGLYYEAAVSAGIIDPTTELPIEPTVRACLTLGTPLEVFIVIVTFINVRISSKLDLLGHSETLFPVFTFAITFIGLAICQYRIHYQFNWVVWIGTIFFASIAALSHGFYMSFSKLRKSINNLVDSAENFELLAKRIELEHESLGATLQWIVWGSIIFLTAGVAGYYYSPFGNPQEPIIGTRLFIALLISTWASLGMFFGAILPATNLMKFLREKIGELSKRQHRWGSPII